MSISKGSDLVLLLLAGFRSLADAAQAELAARGFDDVRPVNGFAIRAVGAGADTASELGRRLTISKQAAAKIIVGLQERGYLERGTDPNDARRKRLQVTEHGFDMLRESEAIFDKLRAQWAQQIGNAKLKDMEAHLSKLTGSEPLRFDAPGWVARGVGAS
jgi:DNA-binding MarR family transcriptional regulator